MIEATATAVTAQVIEYSNLTQGLTIFGALNIVIYVFLIGFSVAKITGRKKVK